MTPAEKKTDQAVPRGKHRPKRSWRRRLLRLGILLLGLVLVGRIALPFVLPSVLDSLVASSGLTLRYGDLNLSLLAGDVQIWNLELSRRREDGGEPVPEDRVARLEYAHVNLDVVSLLSGPLSFSRVVVDGLDVWAETDGDGHVVLPLGEPATTPDEAAASGGSEPPEVEAPDPEAEVDLTPPVFVRSARLQHIRLHVQDPEPQTERWIEASLRLSDLGFDDPTRVQLQVYGPGLLDAVAIEGRASLDPKSIEATVDLDLQGLHVDRAATWLQALGLDPHAELLTAGLHGTVRAAASQAPHTVNLTVDLARVQVTADGKEQLAVDRAQMEVELGPERTVLSDVSIDGVRGHATQLSDGVLRVAGLDLIPVPAKFSSGAPSNTEPLSTQTIDTPGDGTLQVQDLSITNLDLRFRDESIAPAVDLQLLSDRLELRGLDTDPAGQTHARLMLRGRLPDIADDLTIDAQLRPFGSNREADLRLSASGITLDRLTPYLEALGLEPSLDNGELKLHLTAQLEERESGTHGSATLEELSLIDGEPVLEVDRVRVGEFAAEGSVTRLDEVEVEGVRIPLHRDGAGSVHALGMRTIQTTGVARARGAVRAVEAAAGRGTGSESRLELGSLRVRAVAMPMRDELLDTEFGPENLEVDLDNIVIGGSTADASAGQLSLRLRSAFADELRVDGSVTTGSDPLDLSADLRLAGEGLHLEPLAPYLLQLGIEPAIRDGTVRASLSGQARLNADGRVELGAQITDLSLTDAADLERSDLLAFSALRVEGAGIDGRGIHIDQLSLLAPELRARRQADGRLRIAGLILSPVADVPNTPEPIAQPGPGEAAAAAVTIGRLGLADAVLRWRDESRTPAVETALTLGFQVEGLTTGSDAPAVPFAVTLGRLADGATVKLEGQATLDPMDLRAEARIEAQGLRPGPLLPYVPPGVSVTWADGRFSGDLQASLSRAPEGGQSVELIAGNLLFRDGESGAPLLQCDAVRLVAPRLDDKDQVYQVTEVAVQGLELTAERVSESAISLLGVTIDSPSAVAPTTTIAVNPQEEDPEPEAGAAAGSGETSSPRITIDKLDLQLERLSFSDLGSAKPVELSLHLTSREPLVLLDAPEDLAPLRLRLEGAASPLVERIAIDWEVFPWLSEARLEANLEVSGINGQELADVMPALAEGISGEQLQDGQLVGEVSVFTELSRRGVMDFDFQREFRLDLRLENWALRATPDGDVLAGIGDLLLTAPSVTPRRAYLSGLDLMDIEGEVWRDESGLHIAGLTFKPQAAPVETGNAQESPPSPPAPAPPVRDAAAPAFEVAIERVTTTGLKFEYRDTTIDPPLVIPLEGLDVEVEGFSTRAFTAPEPFRFNIALNGGPVKVPVRPDSAGLIGGVISAAGGMVGAAGEVQVHEKPLMEEISWQGELTLYPSPEGRVRASLIALELVALSPLAADAGVKLSDGVLDFGIDMRFEGSRGVLTDANLTFTHLALEESSDGPISTYLRLPAPTNTVIFLLKNDQDEIVIPLTFRAPEGGIASGTVAREAIRAFQSLVTDAIAGSPYRVTGTVTNTITNTLSSIGSLFGLGGGSTEPESGPPPIALEFDPGDPALTAAGKTVLDGVAATLRSDGEMTVVLHHEFGTEDIRRAERLANPSPEQTRDMVTRLRQRRAELISTRARVAADARAHHAIGSAEAATSSTARLQGINQELGEIEDGLDEVLQLLRPNADRRSDYRTLVTALEIGNERLQTVRRYLLDACGPEYDSRIEVRRGRRRWAPGAQESFSCAAQSGEPPLGRVIATPRRRRR